MDPTADMASRVAVGAAVGASHTHALASRATRARTVLVVMAVFTYDVTHCPREAKSIARALYGYPFKAAIYAARMIGYIVQTDLTADEMMERVREPLAAGCIDRGWVFTPGADVASNLPLDPFVEKVADAWREVRRFNASPPSRRLPETIFAIARPIEGERGEVSTRILDHHPLRPAR
jgi:hypothetical protein